MKPLGIALLGFGTVGSAIYKIITSKGAELTKQTRQTMEIRHILVKDLNKVRPGNTPTNLLERILAKS